MPEAPATITERCLQIHITSLQDAKAVIRALQKVRNDYVAYSCTAIELYVFAGLENETLIKDLSQNFRWCKTYRTITKVAPGNVLFAVPHYEEEAHARLKALAGAVRSAAPVAAKKIKPPRKAELIPA